MLVARNRRPKMLGAPSFPLSRVGLQRVHKGAASVGLTGPNGVRHILSSRTPMPVRLGAVAWYNFTDSSKLIGGAAPTTDVAGWKDSSVSNVEVSGDLVTNGSLDTNLSGWTIQNTDANNTITWDNGTVHIVSDATTATSLRLRQAILVGGSWHKIKFDVVEATGTGNLRLQNEGTVLVDPIPNIAGSYEYIIYAEFSDLRFTNIGRTNVNIKLDNIEAYELDSATVAYDLSQSDPAAQPTFTQPNGPIVFDGSDRLVEDTGTLTFATNATFAFKMKSGVQTANSRILSCKSLFSASAGFHIAFPSPTATNTMHIRGSGGTIYDQVLTTDTTTESNIIITFSGTTCKVWQDGVLQGTGTIDTLSAGDVDLSVGSNGAGSEFFTGDFHELSCYQRALTDSEVLQLNAWMNR